MSERLSDEQLEGMALWADEDFNDPGMQVCAKLLVPLAIAELRAARVVVEAAKAWRGSQVDVSSNPNRPYYIDADDGNVGDGGMTRAPIRNALIAAIDALAGAK